MTCADKCSISVPEVVRNLDSAWRTCSPLFGGGFYDPPRTLLHGTQLVPTATVSPTLNNPPRSATPSAFLPNLPPSTLMPPLPMSTPMILEPVRPPIQPVASRTLPSAGSGPLITLPVNIPPEFTLPPGGLPEITSSQISNIDEPIGLEDLPGLLPLPNETPISVLDPERKAITVNAKLNSAASRVFVVDDKTFTADDLGRLTIDGSILTPGGTITAGGRTVAVPNANPSNVDGTAFILETGARRLIVGSPVPVTFIKSLPVLPSGLDMDVYTLYMGFYDDHLTTTRMTVAAGSRTSGTNSIATRQPDADTWTIGGITIGFDPKEVNLIIDDTHLILLSDVLLQQAMDERLIIIFDGHSHTIFPRTTPQSALQTAASSALFHNTPSASVRGRTFILGGETIMLMQGQLAIVLTMNAGTFAAAQATPTTRAEVSRTVSNTITTPAGVTTALDPTEKKIQPSQSNEAPAADRVTGLSSFLVVLALFMLS